MTRPLTPKQELFCREYLVDFNATQAAIRAGYSHKTAQPQSSRLLSNAIVSVKLSELTEKRMAEADVSVTRVLLEFRRIAMVDVGEAYDDLGNFKPLKDIPEDVRRCIAGIESEELWEGRGEDRKQVGVLKKVKFWDKKGSLDSLGKYLKMFVEKVELSADDSLSRLIEDAYRPKA